MLAWASVRCLLWVTSRHRPRCHQCPQRVIRDRVEPVANPVMSAMPLKAEVINNLAACYRVYALGEQVK
jgi:uncharacterized protein with PIN domain